MDISGQAAIVTGGGSGLGAATAQALAGKGAKVALVDIEPEAVTAVARRIGGVGLHCDVTDADAAQRAVQQAAAAHGPARILINCAGIATARRVVGRDGPMPLEEFERIVRVNLIGTFNMLRLLAAGMTRLDPLTDGERGVIVSTTSVAAFEGQIGQAAYSASKGGVAAMTLPVARELAQFGVRALAIAPGLFQTPLLAGLPEEAQAALAKSIPFPPRLGSPDEFAALVVHCIENRYLNGEVIRLDAALRMQPR